MPYISTLFRYLKKFLGLVREVDRDTDPHEGKEWFHAHISKDQAYNLLTAGKPI